MERSISEIDKLFIENNIDYDRCNVIAFDVFDTILYRRVLPEETLKMWADKMITTFNIKENIHSILIKRRVAGWIAKLNSIRNGKDKECEYRSLISILRNFLGLQIPEEEFYKESLNIEVGIEKKVCYIPQKVHKLVESASRTGKTIICISDFYLPASAIKEILKHNGVSLDNIYSSSDFQRLKSTGNLYPEVANLLGLKTRDMVMIGDNRISDYRNAIHNECQAILLKNDYQNRMRDDILAAEKEFFEFNKYILRDDDTFAKVGGSLYLFIDGLYKQLVNDGCSTILFMSREGLFFKQLFDSYQNYKIENEKLNLIIETKYFYCSRHASLIPSIFTIEKESFKEIYRHYPDMRISDFLKNLDLYDNDEIRKEFEELLESDSLIENFENSEEYSSILNSEIFKHICLKKAQEQRDFFKQYLLQLDPNYEQNGLYIVDIGYHGTTSRFIANILEKKAKVKTYYLLSKINPEDYDKLNPIKGILFDNFIDKRFNIFTYDEMVLETIVTANHGSVVAYKKEGELIYPVLNSDKREIECFDDIIAPIQNRLLEVFMKQMEFISILGIGFSKYRKIFLKQYKKFIFSPSIKEMKLYSKIPYIDNFAAYRENQVFIDKGNIKKFSFKSFLKLVRSKGLCIREQNTNWVAVSLYRMNLNSMNKLLYFISPIIIVGYNFYLKIRTKI